ncbi:MAG: PEP-CTERM sorting domain-containing protein [Alphaproteobacteria bacterium]
MPDTFAVTINGQTHSYLSADTGSSAGGFPLNTAPIDLSSFGLGSGASVSSVFIDLSTVSVSTTPSLSFAGVLNAAPAAVPEPGSLLLLGAGLIGLLGMKRYRRLR